MNVHAPYSELSPEAVLDAVETLNFRCDGRVLALNSYENRVYQVGVEETQVDGMPGQGGSAAASLIVAKFYRPHRWSDAAILDLLRGPR